MKSKDLVAKAGTICAVIPTHNRKALLSECLTALCNQTKKLDEIIVIDNASTDGTEDLAKSQFPGITYVGMSENTGSSGGFREGMKLAYEKGYDWIWVMDDDAVPMIDALEKLLNPAALLQDKVYALATAVLNRDRSICLDHRRLFDAKKVKEKQISAAKYKEDYFSIDTASFTGLLVSRNAIEGVGLPRKDFFIYYDDTEYSLRMREKGIIITVPGSKIVHYGERHSPSMLVRLKRPMNWMHYYVIRNQIYTYHKYNKSRIVFRTRLLAEVLIFFGVVLVFRHSKFQSMKVLIRSVLDGLRSNLGKNIDFVPD